TLAAALLLCSGIVGFGAFPERAWSLYQLQGLIYPLSLAGGLLLWQHHTVWRSRWPRVAGHLLLLALAAPRVPQFKGTLAQTTKLKPGIPGFIARSHITAIVDRVGKGPVDLCHREVCANLVALVELGVRHIPVQYRQPSWQLTVGYRGWPVPHYAHPARYLLTGWHDGNHLPSGSIVNPVWALVPDDGTWICEVKPPVGLARDPLRGWHFWVGRAQTVIEVSNDTTAPIETEFVANTEMPGAPTDPRQCVLTW